MTTPIPMTTPGSTLVEELEQAANRTGAWAQEAGWAGRADLADKYFAEAARLRERAALVAKMLSHYEGAVAAGSVQASVELSVLRSLTGPIAAPRETTPINQCDGCRRGVPVNKNGHHEINDYPGEVMACTADRYRRAAPEKKETP